MLLHWVQLRRRIWQKWFFLFLPISLLPPQLSTTKQDTRRLSWVFEATLSNVHLTWSSRLPHSCLSVPSTHMSLSMLRCFEHLGKKHLRLSIRSPSCFFFSNQDSLWIRTESCHHHNSKIMFIYYSQSSNHRVLLLNYEVRPCYFSAKNFQRLKFSQGLLWPWPPHFPPSVLRPSCFSPSTPAALSGPCSSSDAPWRSFPWMFLLFLSRYLWGLFFFSIIGIFLYLKLCPQKGFSCWKQHLGSLSRLVLATSAAFFFSTDLPSSSTLHSPHFSWRLYTCHPQNPTPRGLGFLLVSWPMRGAQ